MKFFLVAAACLAVAVAGPTRGLLTPESAGPIVIEGEEINVGPAIVKPEEGINIGPAIVKPEEGINIGPAIVEPEGEGIAIGPAYVENVVNELPALVQVVININKKQHIVEIPTGVDVPSTDPALVIEEETNPIDTISVNPAVIGKPELPILINPAQIGEPELPILINPAVVLPEELN